MRGFRGISLFGFVIGCLMSLDSLAYRYSISAHFNHNPRFSYKDPYRNITRKGENLEKIIVDMIDSSEKELLVAVQELRLPYIAKAIVRAKKRGVKVKVILENQYNSYVHQMEVNSFSSSALEEKKHEASRYEDLHAFVDKNNDGHLSKKEVLQRDAVMILAKAKVHVIDDMSDGSKGSGLMHHKFVIVDGKKLLVSSANFTLSGIHGDYRNSNSRGNANSLVVMNSPKMAKHYKEEFFQMWNSSFGLQKPYRGVKKASISRVPVEVQFSPTQSRYTFEHTVNGKIARTLRQAKKDIKIALFVFSDQHISNTLEDISQNEDVDIKLLIERKFAERAYSEMLDMWGLQLRDSKCRFERENSPWRAPLQYSAGVSRMTSGDMLHHKFAVIDEEIVIFGSQNWSDSANFNNDESILIIRDKYIAKLYSQEFDRLFRRSNLGPSANLLRSIDKAEEYCSNF